MTSKSAFYLGDDGIKVGIPIHRPSTLVPPPCSKGVDKVFCQTFSVVMGCHNYDCFTFAQVVQCIICHTHLVGVTKAIQHALYTVAVHCNIISCCGTGCHWDFILQCNGMVALKAPDVGPITANALSVSSVWWSK